MPTFEIANTTPIHVRNLAASGDVDGNLYRNLMYVHQLTFQADDENTGNIYIGGPNVSPTNKDAELAGGDSANHSEPGGVDSYLTIDKMLAAPGAPTVANGAAGTNLLEAGEYRYKITFVTAEGETEAGTASAILTNDPAGELPPDLSAIPTDATAGVTVTARKIYRTEVDGSVYKLVDTLADNTTTVYTDNIPDGDLGADAPATNSAVPMKVNLMWESTFSLELS